MKRTELHSRQAQRPQRLILKCGVVFVAALVVSTGTAPTRDTHVSTSAMSFGAGVEQTLPDNGPNVSPEEVFAEAEKLQAEQLLESNKAAVEKYRTAGRMWRDSNRLPQAAEALRNAGVILHLLGDTGDALLSFKASLALSRQGNDALEESKALNEIGYLYFISGDSHTARQHCSNALAIARRIKDQSVEAQALSNIGEAYYGLGDLTTAQKYQRQALDLWRELSDQRRQSHALVALGYYSAHLGEPGEALDLYEQALSLSRSLNDVRGQTRALYAIGNLKRKTGEDQEAFDAYAVARPLAEQTGDRLSLASILGGIGYIYFGLGDAQTALGYVEKGTQIFESLNEKWGMAEGKMDLGRIHHARNDVPKALECFNAALSLFKELSMPRLQAQTLRDIGRVYAAVGNRSNALKAYEQALKLTRLGQDQRHEAYTLNYIGELYESLGNKTKAVDYYKRALPLNRKAADPAGETLTLYNLARLERDSGNLPKAQQLIEQTVKIADSHRTKVFSQDLRSSYFATVQLLFELNIDVVMQRHKQEPAAGFVAEAFAVSEKGRARSFLELMQEGRANTREGVPPELLQKESSLKATLNAKAERHVQLQARKEVVEAEKIEKEISELTSSLRQVRDQIKSTSSSNAALTLQQPLNLKQVQESVLDDDSVLLEYALGDERSYLWVVTRNDVSSYELPRRAEIEESAMRLYKLFTAYQPSAGESLSERERRQNEAGTSVPSETALLSRLVLGPLAGKLNNKRLLIVPDGALQYVPFASLFDPDSPSESPRLLIANHEVVNQPSASALAVVLSRRGTKSKATHAVAVLADPVFEIDDPRVRNSRNQSANESVKDLELRQTLRDIGISIDGVQIPRLYASGQEADGIVSAAPWGTGLKAVGFDATRKRVLGDELANYRIIHFATHGLINNEHPELSGIVLSLFDEEGKPQDGFLRLHDIYNLRLPADLVVLSACSTGLGKNVKGEGFIGLTRGFMYAGASGIVASLWKVDDEATAALMRHFYNGLFVGKLTPAAALRSAQLKTSQDKRWQAPYYWAGFVIQGQYNQNELVPGQFAVRQRWVVIISLAASILIMATILLVNAIRRRRD